MTFKRKRSASELSSPTSSTTSTFPASSPLPFNPFASSPMSNAPHLPSRTLKRSRGGRPADDEVHRKFYEWRAHHRDGSSRALPGRTLGLLYSAQRQSGAAAPAHHQGEYSTDGMAVEGGAAQGGAQRSLHSFWTIPSAPNATPAAQPIARSEATACDECGIDLPGSDSGAMDMDMDVDGRMDPACGPCGRRVCGQCSVTNVDGMRRCLQCAGRKVWVGGLGWTTAPGVAV